MRSTKTSGIIVLVLALIALPVLMGTYLDTVHKEWKAVEGRTDISSADAALGATARKWADRPTAKLLRIREEENRILLAFALSTAGANCTYEVWSYADDSDAELVASGTATAGTQTATGGGYYAHAITCTSRWMLPWESTDTSGNNEIAKLWGDGCGNRYWLVRINSISAGGVTVYKRSF